MTTFLVVEDNMAVRITLEAVLSRKDINVIICSCAEEAFGIIKSKKPDLIITDIVMPGMNGIDFSKKIKSLYPDIKIMAISGGGYTQSEQSPLEIIKPFVDDTLEKPFSTEELNNKISRFINL